jgi:L-fuculose-phosphate aldolase
MKGIGGMEANYYSEKKLRTELCDMAHRMYDAGYSPASSGNLSVRLAEDAYLITPSGVCKKDLTEERIVCVNGKGELLSGSGKASSEFRVHLFCYTHRPDVMGVCHSHAPFATALSCLKCNLDRYFLPDQLYYLGAVPRCTYHTSGTQAVAESMKPYIEKHNALLLGNHGTVTLGGSVSEAFERLEAFEQYAKVFFVTSLLGGAREFTKEEAQDMFDEIQQEGIVHPGNIRF